MSKRLWPGGRGPFRADQVRSGDPHELSRGHPIVCAPTGQEGAGPNGLGFAVLDSDLAVKRAGVEVHERAKPARVVGADGELTAPCGCCWRPRGSSRPRATARAWAEVFDAEG